MPLTRQGNTLRLDSPFYRREIDLSSGPFSCAVFTRSPDTAEFLGHHHLSPQGLPFEAAVKIGGTWLEVGIHEHRQPLWRARGSVFDVADVVIGTGKYGPQATLVCRPPPSFTPQVEVAIEYELSETLPFLRKAVHVTNRSATPILVQNLCPEVHYAVRIDRELVFLHDFRRDVRVPDDFYVPYVRFQFPGDIDLTLAPGETVDSFNLYAVCTPGDEEGRGVWRQRVLKALAPWVCEPDLALQCDGIRPRSDMTGPEQFCRLADQCADVGFEKVSFFVTQLWTNIGDYVIRPDLFPEGEHDLKRVVDYFHAKGLKVGPYTSYCIAWHGSRVREDHLDWECTGAEGQRFDPGGFGNMCFLSDWGDTIRRKILWMADELGFDEIHMDGPTDIPCYQTNHRHRNEADYEYLNWQWERRFFNELRARGKYLTLPRSANYLLMGISAMPGGYTEEDFCNSEGMAQLVNCRARLYQARYAIPACASWGFLAADPYHRHALGISEDEPWIYDHALGGLIGYGHAGLIHGTRLFCGPRTEAIVRKWVAFYRQYRDTLRGDFLHIAAPDGIHVDAVLHTQAGASTPAVAVVFNPQGRAQTAHLCFPLAYAGFAPRTVVSVPEHGPAQLDDRAVLALTLTLQPREVRTLAFSDV